MEVPVLDPVEVVEVVVPVLEVVPEVVVEVAVGVEVEFLFSDLLLGIYGLF